MRLLLLLLFMIVIVCASFPNSAMAQYTDGEACGGAGQPPTGAYHTKNDATTVTHMYCNGTNWIDAIQIDATRANSNKSAIISSVIIASRAFGQLSIGSGIEGINHNLGIGYNVNTASDFGTAIGHGTTSGPWSVALGHEALSSNRSVVLGARAGLGSSNSFNNIYIGHHAGSNVNGNNNIHIIRSTNALPASTLSNNLNIGNTIFGNITGAATDGTGTARVGINKPVPSVALDVIGDIQFTGVLADVSDRRQKDDIRILADPLERLKSVYGVSFVMKNDPEREREIGIIAQDVEAAFPELVKTYDGVKSVNYQGMIGPLVEAVKELDAQNDVLAAENATLRSMIEDLSKRMDDIERDFP